MSHKPCENFKCRYEHQKLIEKVKKLEREQNDRVDCLDCPSINQLKKENDWLLKENRRIYDSHCIMNDRIRTFKFSLYAESLMLVIASVVILKLALGW